MAFPAASNPIRAFARPLLVVSAAFVLLLLLLLLLPVIEPALAEGHSASRHRAGNLQTRRASRPANRNRQTTSTARRASPVSQNRLSHQLRIRSQGHFTSRRASTSSSATQTGGATKRDTSRTPASSNTANGNSSNTRYPQRPRPPSGTTANNTGGQGGASANNTNSNSTGNYPTRPQRPYPSNGNGRPNPATGNGRPYPSTGNGRPDPTTSNGRPYPTTGNGRPYPTTGNGRPYPTTGNGRPYPTTGDGGRYPTANGRPYPTRGGQSASANIMASQGSAGATPTGTQPRPNLGGGRLPPSIPLQRSGRRPGTGVPTATERRYVPDEVVVEVASAVSPQALATMARRYRLTRLQTLNLQLTGTTILRWRINDRRSVAAVVRELEADGSVMAVQPNYIANLQQVAAAAAAPVEQYALSRMRIPEAHALATGNQVLIGVVDSGVDTQHPEFAGLVIRTFDAIGSGDRVHPHGTAIVGAIMSHARLRGTGPGAHILAARAFGTTRSTSDGTTFNIITAIDWVATQGAQIINMSFAGPRDPAIERSLGVARARGIVLVAAAGNAGPNSPPLFPAANPQVIAVTATDENDTVFRGANRGFHIAVAAPGVDLMLPAPSGGYTMISGTSFAAAEVSGAVALILERNPGLSPDDVRQALVSTARDLGAQGLDPLYGAGLVDAYRAVLSVAPAAAPTTAAAPMTTGGSASQ